MFEIVCVCVCCRLPQPSWKPLTYLNLETSSSRLSPPHPLPDFYPPTGGVFRDLPTVSNAPSLLRVWGEGRAGGRSVGRRRTHAD